MQEQRRDRPSMPPELVEALQLPVPNLDNGVPRPREEHVVGLGNAQRLHPIAVRVELCLVFVSEARLRAPPAGVEQ